jgi:hypothetical protein
MSITAIDLAFLTTGCILLLVAVACAVFAWQKESNLNDIADTRTSTAADLQARFQRSRSGHTGDRVELSGTLEVEGDALIAPRSETPCAAFDYTRIQEDWERRRHAVDWEINQVTKDGQNERLIYRNQDRQREQLPRFYVRDDTGRVEVDPEGAQFDLKETDTSFECYTNGTNTEQRIQHLERCLPVDQQVYVLGFLQNNGGAPLVAQYPLGGEQRFLISHRTEEQLAGRARTHSYGLYLAGGLSGGAGVLLMMFAML